MTKLSIITPTYNRSALLRRCFHSLAEQTSMDFEWIVIDDGSTDDTRSVIQSFLEQANHFPIIPIFKENGGKHTALNASHSLIRGDYVLILDSDDYLTSDAVETVNRTWERYREQESIGVVSFYKALPNGEIVSKKLKESPLISDHISFRVNEKSGGDQCETVRSSYFKQFVFPVYSGEKFASEGLLWNYLGFRYQTVYINQAIYTCDYLVDGISNSGKKLLMSNPKGMIDLAQSFFHDRVCLKIRIKQTWLYIVYSLCDKRTISEIVKKSGQKLLTLSQLGFGILLYLFWKKKYL